MNYATNKRNLSTRLFIENYLVRATEYLSTTKIINIERRLCLKTKFCVQNHLKFKKKMGYIESLRMARKTCPVLEDLRLFQYVWISDASTLIKTKKIAQKSI